MIGVQGEQGRGIVRQAEEPAFFNGPFNGGLLRRQLDRLALAVFTDQQFGFVIIGFVAHRVPAFVAAEIQVAIGVHALPQLLAQRLVIVVGGADEAIEADAELPGEFDKGLRGAIDIGARR